MNPGLARTAIAALILCAATAAAQERELDPGYGTAGTVVLPERLDAAAWGYILLPAASLALPDGRALYAGRGTDGRIVVRRLTADGRVDASFGGSGAVVLPMDRGSPGLAVDASGRVLVAAAFSPSARPAGAAADASVVRVVRLLPDGSPDRSFATDGAADRELSSAPLSVRLALDDAGRILVAAGADDARAPLHLWRLLTGGDLDPAYRNGPVATIGVPDVRRFPIAMQAMADGSAYVLVEAPLDELDDTQHLLRFDPGGAFDRIVASSVLAGTAVAGFSRLNGIARDGAALWILGQAASSDGAILQLTSDGTPGALCVVPMQYLNGRAGIVPSFMPLAIVHDVYSNTLVGRATDDRQNWRGLLVMDIDDDCSPYTGSYGVFEVPPASGLSVAYVGRALSVAGTTLGPALVEARPAAVRLRTVGIGGTPTNPGVVAFQSYTILVEGGADAALLYVSRTGGRAGPASVEVQTADGTARAYVDYGPVRTRLDWAAGEDGPKTIRVPLLGRPPSGTNLYFEARLQAATGALLAGTPSVQVWITGSAADGSGGAGSAGGGSAPSPAPAPAPSPVPTATGGGGGGGATSPSDLACLLASALVAARRRQRRAVA